MIRYLSALFIVAFSFGLFAQQDSSGTASKKVLLAYENTGFKKALIEKMNSLLKKDGIDTKIIEHSNGELDKENAGEYQAIFVTNSGVNSQVRPWIMDWIKKNEQFVSSIILHTTQTKDWKVEVPVDAVTSASEKNKVKNLATEYIKLINQKLTAEK